MDDLKQRIPDETTAVCTVKAINRHLRRKRVLEGGLKFGLDWVTWNICHPQLAKAVDYCGELITRRTGRFLPRYRYGRTNPHLATQTLGE